MGRAKSGRRENNEYYESSIHKHGRGGDRDSAEECSCTGAGINGMTMKSVRDPWVGRSCGLPDISDPFYFLGWALCAHTKRLGGEKRGKLAPCDEMK